MDTSACTMYIVDETPSKKQLSTALYSSSPARMERSSSLESLLGLNVLASDFLNNEADEDSSRDLQSALSIAEPTAFRPHDRISSGDGSSAPNGLKLVNGHAGTQDHLKAQHNRYPSEDTAFSKESSDYANTAESSSTRRTSYDSSRHSYDKLRPGDEETDDTVIFTQPIKSELEHAFDESDGAHDISETLSLEPYSPRLGATSPSIGSIEESSQSSVPIASTESPASGLKIADWLRHQYDSGIRASPPRPPSRRRTSRRKVSTGDSLASVLETQESQSPIASPSTPLPRANESLSRSKDTFSRRVSRKQSPPLLSRESQFFRRGLLTEIIARDFAPDAKKEKETVEGPQPADCQLWHPSEYVGPVKRKKSGGSSSLLATKAIFQNRLNGLTLTNGSGQSSTGKARASMDAETRPLEEAEVPPVSAVTRAMTPQPGPGDVTDIKTENRTSQRRHSADFSVLQAHHFSRKSFREGQVDGNVGSETSPSSKSLYALPSSSMNDLLLPKYDGQTRRAVPKELDPVQVDDEASSRPATPATPATPTQASFEPMPRSEEPDEMNGASYASTLIGSDGVVAGQRPPPGNHKRSFSLASILTTLKHKTSMSASKSLSQDLNGHGGRDSMEILYNRTPKNDKMSRRKSWTPSLLFSVDPLSTSPFTAHNSSVGDKPPTLAFSPVSPITTRRSSTSSSRISFLTSPTFSPANYKDTVSPPSMLEQNPFIVSATSGSSLTIRENEEEANHAVDERKLADLAEEQVARDAQYRARLVNRFKRRS